MTDPAIIVALIGLLSTVAAWFLGRKKHRAETTAIELQNMRTAMQTAIDTWKEIAECQTAEIAELRIEMKTQCAEIAANRAEIIALKTENRGLRNEVARLTEMLNNVKTITKSR